MRARYPLNVSLSVLLDCFDKLWFSDCSIRVLCNLYECINFVILQKDFSDTEPFYNVRARLRVNFYTHTHTLMLDVFLSRERLKRCVSGGENKTWRHTQKKYQMSLMSLNMFYYHIQVEVPLSTAKKLINLSAEKYNTEFSLRQYVSTKTLQYLH